MNTLSASALRNGLLEIASFQNTQRGWRFGRGERPTRGIMFRAFRAEALLDRMGANSTGAFLQESGAILVTGYFDHGHAEVMCEVDGSYYLVSETTAGAVTEINDVKEAQLEVKFGELLGAWVNSCDSSTSKTMTRLSIDSRAEFLADQEPMELCRSSPLIVRNFGADQYVSMQNHTTPPFQGIRSYSGDFSRTPSQRRAA